MDTYDHRNDRIYRRILDIGLGQEGGERGDDGESIQSATFDKNEYDWPVRSQASQRFTGKEDTKCDRT